RSGPTRSSCSRWTWPRSKVRTPGPRSRRSARNSPTGSACATSSWRGWPGWRAPRPSRPSATPNTTDAAPAAAPVARLTCRRGAVEGRGVGVAELPSGTVTFLFTDVEGSTRLWEEYPGAMRAALARHDEIVGAAIESGGGRVVKTTGDGFHAVFASAHDA